ncbi:hypothetical protein DUNSADRAFT_7418 [Dunaliella salina]|uniref:Uncharacterized protein n=1 Tax=Dunaliella salina TaxID=3046 RepID=A0ABQ7GLE5_DUNSA|nr:hypothetical protein DUNSADRAFT_7418 [Dunaliella salina]|eukprot:KAF5835430.1 hypothetical protein DUNSADRAFT_7418 [Dunaliella salina]
MDQGKKQARTGSAQATPFAEPHQLSSLSQPATHFLDLGDDIFGIVYGMVDACDDKKALRHSCATLYRSPSVNSHVNEVVLDVEDYPTTPEEGLADIFMEVLKAFPKNATLRLLQVENAGDRTPQVFHRALCADATGARERLKSVQRLTLEGCSLMDGSTAAYWSLLFTNLQNPDGGGELTMQHCRTYAASPSPSL